MVARLFLIAEELGRRVSFGLGLAAPGEPPAPTEPVAPDASGGLDASPALAMVTEDAFPVDGRVVHILAGDGADLSWIRTLRDAFYDAGVVGHVIAPHKGEITGRRKTDVLTVDRSFLTASSAEADAVVVAGGGGLAADPAAITYVQMANRHHKPLGAWGDGAELLTGAGAGLEEPGVVTSERSTKAFAKNLLAALAVHRHWDRAGVHPTRAAVQEA